MRWQEVISEWSDGVPGDVWDFIENDISYDDEGFEVFDESWIVYFEGIDPYSAASQSDLEDNLVEQWYAKIERSGESPSFVTRGWTNGNETFYAIFRMN